MNHKVEALLPSALVAAKYLMADANKLIVHKEYDGYAANLGASIRQSGLLPALSFFTDVHKMKSEADKSGKKPFRNILLFALLHTMKEPNLPDEYSPAEGRELLRRVIKGAYSENVFDQQAAIKISQAPNKEVLKDWEKRILRASVALKLALRSFEHTSSKQEKPAPKMEEE
jgi:hypothetical protein